MSVNKDIAEKIYKKTGSSTRIEVLPSAKEIGCVRINFQSFDPDSLKQTALISFYLPITKAYAFGQNILLGNADGIPKIIGGSPEKKVKNEDGKTIRIPCQYREMSLYKGMKKPWCLTGKACEGETGGKTGGIMPVKGLVKDDWDSVTIAFESDFELDEFASALVMLSQTVSNFLYQEE